jgi:5-methylcytosine-specific restriction enzyme A
MAERVNIVGLTSAHAVMQAIAECDKIGRAAFLAKYGFGQAKTLPLHYNDKIYDSKAIAGVAYGYQHGTFLSSANFTGGVSTVARVLTKLGFPVKVEQVEFWKPPVPGEHPASWLVRGRLYERKELRARYGGQLQAGIWTPSKFNVVFLFTGSSGEAYGYADKWTAAGTYEYCGEGQIGDMTFTGGNKAVRDHRENGEDLFLFRDEGKGKGVRYEGLFECVDYAIKLGRDKTNAERDIIVFELAPVSSTEEQCAGAHASGEVALEDLRKAAYLAATKSAGQKGPKGISTRSWYERAEDVRRYVLARAGGICECCSKPAPFKNKTGSPYLEPHHTTRRADNGLDHPAHVAAVCPDCHRHVHFGIDGNGVNEAIKAAIKAKEGAIGDTEPALLLAA